MSKSRKELKKNNIGNEFGGKSVAINAISLV